MPTLALAPIHNKLTHSWRMFASGSVALPHTGDTVETLLARVSFPPAAMGPNGIVQITTLWSVTNNANIKNPRIQMGLVGITPPGIGGNNLFFANLTTQQSYQTQHMVRNRNNQASQICAQRAFAGAGNALAAVLPLTIDTTGAFDFIFTGQLANGADTITLEAYMVELFYGA